MATPDCVELETSPHPEERLAELARAGGALRRVIAALAGRMVAQHGWERLGYARVGDYARERLGISGRSLQDLARVDGALADRPHLEAALATGTLPWSKVRMLARFVSQDDEAVWIAHAHGVSVRTLEHHVRAVDRGALENGGAGADVDEDEATATVRIRGPGPVAYKWHQARKAAANTAGEPVPAGALLEWVTAEALAALPAPLVSDAEAADVARRDGLPDPGEPEVQLCPPLVLPEGVPTPAPSWTLPPFLSPLLHRLELADAFELDLRLRRAVRLEQRRDAELAPLLSQVTAPEFLWREQYKSLATLAREDLGMSPRKARALLRLERVGACCPELQDAFRDGRLSWVQAQCLARLLGIQVEGDWRETWVAFAERVTVRRLQAAVEQMLFWHQADPDAWSRGRDHPELALPSEPAPDTEAAWDPWQTCARPTDFRRCSLRVEAPVDVVALFRAAVCTLRRLKERETGRLPEEWEVLDVMLEHALVSWGHVGEGRFRPRVRRSDRVLARDGWRCTVPGCSSKRNLQVHHVVYRSAGGGDQPENLTTLCAWHHLRGVHGGVLRVAGRAPDALRFEIGLRKGQEPLQRFEAGDQVA